MINRGDKAGIKKREQTADESQQHAGMKIATINNDINQTIW
jgi:hypothetical protein